MKALFGSLALLALVSGSASEGYAGTISMYQAVGAAAQALPTQNDEGMSPDDDDQDTSSSDGEERARLFIKRYNRDLKDLKDSKGRLSEMEYLAKVLAFEMKHGIPRYDVILSGDLNRAKAYEQAVESYQLAMEHRELNKSKPSEPVAQLHDGSKTAANGFVAN